ncbi:MAG: YggU family protein [Candidatus Melainabacteria bacterium GWF2_37_15]|nr:MAG: YggU family protein [Candidatus Melainabacteria bacterium GWF2_37_15]
MDGIKLNIKVIPNASKCEIVGFVDNILKIRLNVPPVDGKANEKCIKFLSKLLDVPKTSISIISGEKSRLKVLFIKGDPEELNKKLSTLKIL